ncbi:MAG: 4-alpha-glucanotransferase [Candidatus Dormibacteraeota bacterium]|nr:4-alpha-glucanotransferase [Candidatus Dormibacteraeota bacterium]MBV9525033.1 4-alpha-glucanotransferase [Candidatus Dormibacteraeota bacterium]
MRRSDAARWGVQTEYVDATGTRRTVPQRSVRAVLDALGADGAAPPGEPSGARRGPVARCHPAPERGWGWAAQLYALRSRRSWGMGDLDDLAALGRWASGLGASMLMLNPLHAPQPWLPQEASPYFPSSRLFRNPLYLRVEAIPGATESPLVRRLQREGRALNASPVIQRDAIFALKMQALEHLWTRFGGDRRFDAYCASEGEALLRYATHCVIAEQRRKPWRQWPRALQSPGSAAVRRIAERERRRVDFHRWLQWQTDTQLARAARTIPLVHDLAVGTSPDGADAWMWHDVMAFGARIGAPPDEFSPGGQNWGLVPFDPHRLRDAGYRPLREMLHRLLRLGAGVRIDHVMGLFRLWWIPAESDARGGAYVRYPWHELLDVIAEESARASAYVVGEDLGTVETGVRAQLRRRGVLSYRVMWFERARPERYPVEAMAAMTTHDLPTVTGVWTGADIDELAASGRPINLEAELRLRRRLRRLTALPDRAPTSSVVERAYAELGAAPSRLLSVTLEDAAAAPRRPNLPGATERDNWSLPLPLTLDQLRRSTLARNIAATMRAAGR